MTQIEHELSYQLAEALRKRSDRYLFDQSRGISESRHESDEVEQEHRSYCKSRIGHYYSEIKSSHYTLTTSNHREGAQLTSRHERDVISQQDRREPIQKNYKE